MNRSESFNEALARREQAQEVYEELMEKLAAKEQAEAENRIEDFRNYEGQCIDLTIRLMELDPEFIKKSQLTGPELDSMLGMYAAIKTRELFMKTDVEDHQANPKRSPK